MGAIHILFLQRTMALNLLEVLQSAPAHPEGTKELCHLRKAEGNSESRGPRNGHSPPIIELGDGESVQIQRCSLFVVLNYYESFSDWKH